MSEQAGPIPARPDLSLPVQSAEQAAARALDFGLVKPVTAFTLPDGTHYVGGLPPSYAPRYEGKGRSWDEALMNLFAAMQNDLVQPSKGKIDAAAEELGVA